jgi:dihydroorotase
MAAFTLIEPDDWHCHLREGDRLMTTVKDQASQFSRAMVMPNLQQPVVSFSLASAYRDSILQHVPTDNTFEPLMTLYLNNQLTVKDLEQAKASGFVIAVKYYPKGATTLSEFGVSSWQQVKTQLAAMERLGLVLSIHGEVVDESVDIFDREEVFLNQELSSILREFPRLKVVLEHISTQAAVSFVKQSGDNLAATITPHHLLLNRNDLLVGGVKPHHYCLPIVKKHQDQAALIEAALSGHPRFFLGTDSAPHARSAKESACGCAGIYSAFAAIEYYAEVFSQYESMERLEDFASVYGAKFYGLPLNQKKITLDHQPWVVPETLPFSDSCVVPLLAGQTLQWKRTKNDK